MTPTNTNLFDGASVAIMLGALTDILPPMAAGLTIVWTGIRIYETETVQRLLGRKTNNSDDI